jgi:hypothetical protein
MKQNEKILYLLKFDTSKTLHENKEIFLNEQATEWEKRELKKIEGFSNKLSNLSDIDPHDALMWTSLAANFFGPWGMAASIALDLGNAYLYHKEGKNFEAGLQVAFSLIPGGELVTKIPIVKKYGKKFFENMLLKSVKGGVITRAEREAYKELTKYSKWIKSSVYESIFKMSLRQVFKGFRFTDIVKFIWLLQKRNPKWYFITRIGIEIGGVYYTYLQLAKIFGWSDKEEKNPKKQQKIENDYKKSPEKYNEEIIDDLTKDLFSLPESVRDSIAMSSINDAFN